MKEFIIDETYEQICINSEGNIEISGLWGRGACNIAGNARRLKMPCRTFKASVDEKAGITIDVAFNSVILKDKTLSILLNPEEYPVETIDINIK